MDAWFVHSSVAATLLYAAFVQFTIGNVLTILTILGLGTAGYYRLRALKNDQLQTTVDFWRQEAEGLKEVVEEQRLRTDDLTRQRDEQRSLKHSLRAELAAEKLKTDLTGVLKQMSDSHGQIVARVETAERVGVEAMVGALEGLEDRMGAKLDAFLADQGEIAETLRGLLHGMGDLNKKIASRP